MFTYLPFIVYISHETDYSFSQTAGLVHTFQAILLVSFDALFVWQSLLSTTAFGVGCNYVARLEDWGLGLQWHTIGMNMVSI